MDPPRVYYRAFPDGHPLSRTPDAGLVDEYLQDLTACYGSTLSRPLAELNGHTYAELAVATLGALGPLPRPVRVVAVATAVPDADGLHSPSSRVASLIPDDPLPCGVADQGRVTGFTALRMAAVYAREWPTGYAIVLIMDQRNVPYPVDGAEELVPTRDAAVAIVLNAGAGASTENFVLRQRTHVSRNAVRSSLEAELHAALATAPAHGHGRPGTDVALVAGHGLAEAAGLEPAVPGMASGVLSAAGSRPRLPADVRWLWRAPPGLVCTGVWAALAAAMPKIRPFGGRVVVAEYEPTLSYLSVCRFDLRPVPAQHEPIRLLVTNAVPEEDLL